MGEWGGGSGGKGEGSGVRRREVGNAYPPVHPLIKSAACCNILLKDSSSCSSRDRETEKMDEQTRVCIITWCLGRATLTEGSLPMSPQGKSKLRQTVHNPQTNGKPELDRTH